MFCGRRHRSSKARAQCIEVAPVAAVDQQAMRDLRREIAGTEAGGEYKIREPLDPITSCDDVATSEGSCERLGKAPNENHPLEAVEGRKAWRGRASKSA